MIKQTNNIYTPKSEASLGSPDVTWSSIVHHPQSTTKNIYYLSHAQTNTNGSVTGSEFRPVI